YHDGERAEHLFLRDAHGRLYVGKHGGLDVITVGERGIRRNPAAGHQPRSFFDTEARVIEHAFLLLRRDHRTELYRGIAGIADAQPARFGREPIDELLVDALLHDMAARADARLPRADEGAERRVIHRLVDIKIVEHDHRRFSAELERL